MSGLSQKARGGSGGAAVEAVEAVEVVEAVEAVEHRLNIHALPRYTRPVARLRTSQETLFASSQLLEVGEVVEIGEEKVDMVYRHEPPDEVGDVVFTVVARVDALEVTLEGVDSEEEEEDRKGGRRKEEGEGRKEDELGRRKKEEGG